MLCPEVWHFKAPRHRFECHDTLGQPSAAGTAAAAAEDETKKCSRPTDAIKAHYFNHSVSVVLPNTSGIPERFNENVLEDSDYYRIDGLRAVELVNKEFIESFVKKGELSLLTVERRIDTDNLAAIGPGGHLLLSLLRDTYQRLGIDLARPTSFERRDHSRYVVTIDLKDDKLTPGKKYYERIRNSLEKLPELTFNVVLSWDPPEEKMCPSSVAAWFHNRGYSVSVCHVQPIRRAEYSLEIPVLDDNYNLDNFFEWLGLFSVGGKLKNETEHDKYVSTYNCPTPKMEVGQVQYLQFTGFFTRRKVQKIYELVKDCTSTNNTLPWCSMDVQGFADSPVSWGLKEHSFYVDGDNSFTIVLRPGDEGYILRKSFSSNNMPKNTQ